MNIHFKKKRGNLTLTRYPDLVSVVPDTPGCKAFQDLVAVAVPRLSFFSEDGD